MQIILASTSRYRRDILTRLGIPFETVAPLCDEAALPSETVKDTTQRVARAKALSLKERFHSSLIIGADQLASLDGEYIGKPRSFEHGIDMLVRMSNRTIVFYSALTLLNTRTGTEQETIATSYVTLRSINRDMARRYLIREPDALHCAGAAKSEGLGSALITKIDSEDPNALIGLPLFSLVHMLAREGVRVL